MRKHRKITLARASTVWRLRQAGMAYPDIANHIHATQQTVTSLLRIAMEQREALSSPEGRQRTCVACGETMAIEKFYRETKGCYLWRCRPCHLEMRRRQAKARETRLLRTIAAPPAPAAPVEWQELWQALALPSAALPPDVYIRRVTKGVVFTQAPTEQEEAETV